MRLPIFDKLLGDFALDRRVTPARCVSGPKEAWAIRLLAPDAPAPLETACGWLDAVADAPETFRADPALAPMADALAATRRALRVVTAEPPARALVARLAAHAVALDVELDLERFPGPPPSGPLAAAGTDERPATADAGEPPAAARLQFCTAPDRLGAPEAARLVAAFDLFPLRTVAARHVDGGAPRPLSREALARALDAPAGTLPSAVLAPGDEGRAGDHLLLRRVGDPEARWLVAATLSRDALAAADADGRLDALGGLLLGPLDFSGGGFVHDEADWALHGARRPSIWHALGRDAASVPTRVTDGGHTVLDLEALPTHAHVIASLTLVAAASVWLGPAWRTLFPAERLATYAGALENRALPGEARRLTLYRDLAAFDAPAHRERQWRLRRALGLDAVAHAVLGLPPPSDACVEMQTTRLPAGVNFRLRFLEDADGAPAPRPRAVRARLYDFDADGRAHARAPEPLA